MDGGEHWRMIRCASSAQDKTIINQIMLRFRPIAPKPASNGSGPVCNNKDIILSKRRTKRKYVRVRKNDTDKGYKRKKKNPSDQEKGKRIDLDSGFNKAVTTTTLQLLPERSDDDDDRSIKGSAERGNSWCNLDDHLTPSNQLLKVKQRVIDQDQTVKNTMDLKERVTTESWVTVECVTDTYNNNNNNTGCMDCRSGAGIGCTDVERVKNLEEDTRPAFISDGWNKVRWVNGAYRRMVSAMKKKEKGNEEEIMVQLVTKEKLVPYTYCCAFTCWVRLQYAWGENKEKSNSSCSVVQIVPCDVWRMDCGGFAWRLDIEAALSLGR